MKKTQEYLTTAANLQETQRVEVGMNGEPGIVNLCDFAFFLSVMQNKEAYSCVLSIILGENDLQLTEVNVEKVVLNKSGKRAIRLDAWALDIRNRQFSIEMQNDDKSDHIPLRSRFYQSMLDSPILKSGKATRYKHLPPTVIIFITQEDIFKRDLAMYTFEEKREEVENLYLEDGTRKIFLNLTSKNGPDELISLLQYIKKTELDNPDIIIRDSRIEKLDEIVQDVRASEEWEELSMNLLNYGIEKGMEKGEIISILKAIDKKQKKKLNAAEIADMLELDIQMVEILLNVILENPDGNEEDWFAAYKMYNNQPSEPV